MSDIPRLSDGALWNYAHRHYPEYDSDTVMSIAQELEQARAELKELGEYLEALEAAELRLFEKLERIQGGYDE